MSSAKQLSEHGGLAIVLLVPAALLLGLSLSSGGFFPDATAIATIVVLLLLIVRSTSASVPFAGLSPALSLAAGALIGFAVWTLASEAWSGSASRALLEYNRALLYAGVLVLTGLLGRSPRRARVLLYGLAVASVAVSVAAVATWLLPHVFPAGESFSRERLGWPTTYWNATGLIAALGIVWTTSLTCSAGERSWIRILAAGMVPLATAALIFTVSRGAVAVGALGLLVALVSIRSRASVGGVATLAPAIATAVVLALGVHGLDTHEPTAKAVAGGQRAAVLLVALAVGTAALRAGLLRLDRRMLGAALLTMTARARWAVMLATGAILLTAFLALGGPGRVRGAVHQFGTQSVSGSLPATERFTQLGSNGRVEQWKVAFADGFRRHPLDGVGAGTYAVLWTRHAPTERRVLDAHSLYIEQLGELGLIGGALLLAALGSMLLVLLRRVRGPEREVWGALLAGTVVWAAHAGVDWDWEMPAVTAWVFAVGGLALAAPPGTHRGEARRGLRLAVGIGCLLLTITPALVWRSQTRLTDAVQALERRDCLQATKAALDSNAAVGARPEPFEIISYCEVGTGRFASALSAVRAAEIRDPQNWELRYAESLIRGVAGLDPRAAARAAVIRYPSSTLTRTAARAFATDDPRRWRRFALAAPLPLPSRTR
jgi:O-antigen ligase